MNLKRINNQQCIRFKEFKLVGDNTNLTSFMMLGQHQFNILDSNELEFGFLEVYIFY